jgi:hypothetical protein
VKPIGKLKDIHKGHDINVVASGASAGYFVNFGIEGHKYEK